jgi:hypothetical protein
MSAEKCDHASEPSVRRPCFEQSRLASHRWPWKLTMIQAQAARPRWQAFATRYLGLDLALLAIDGGVGNSDRHSALSPVFLRV